MQQITSRDNRLIKEGRRLRTDARYRRETGRFFLEGARLCADAARSGVTVETVLVTERALRTYAAQVHQLRRCGGEWVEISEGLAGILADTASPQGIFCLCRALDNRPALGTINKIGRYLALEDIQDPANLGAIIRTAEALGVDGLLLSGGCCDVYNPKVLRGSMGGVFRLPFYAAGNLAETVSGLQEAGMTGWACVPAGEATPVHLAGLGPGCVCLIGNEGAGLKKETIAACRRRLTIVMAGRAESLNASTAAAIVLWELTRPSV